MIRLQLFILGGSPRSVSALQNLAKFRRDFGEDQMDVEVVDVRQNADVAERQKILATPTLVRVLPLPTMRIVGDLSDTALLACFIAPTPSRLM